MRFWSLLAATILRAGSFWVPGFPGPGAQGLLPDPRWCGRPAAATRRMRALAEQLLARTNSRCELHRRTSGTHQAAHSAIRVGHRDSGMA
eukprot:213838-Chlamydomonas_euryale.AAC.5